ncbi:MAG: NCS2 family permease, partial [Propionibacteriaceae bacterium]
MASPSSTPVRPGASSSAPISGLDRFFEITKRGSTVGREVRGGIVTFFTMAYILALNPIILGTTPDKYGRLISGLPIADPKNIGITMAMVAAGTALIAFLMSTFMGIYGKFPMALATGLGINALAAYVIAPQMSWPQTMTLIVLEGLVITALVLTGFREAVFRAVPAPLRAAISVGIGLFIAFIGLWDGGIVRAPKGGATPTELGVGGSLSGWPVAIFVVTLVICALLYARNVKGSLLIALLTGTVLAAIVEAIVKIGPMIMPGKDANPSGWKLNVPAWQGNFSMPDLGTLGQFWPFGYAPEHAHLSATTIFGMALIAFSLLLSDFFDTVGTVVAVGAQAGLLDDEGNPPRLKQILFVDSVAAIA